MKTPLIAGLILLLMRVVLKGFLFPLVNRFQRRGCCGGGLAGAAVGAG
jgi:hypothetical protein